MKKMSLLLSSLLLISQVLYAEEPALIKIDGSSTVYPITQAMAEEFQKEKKNQVRITVGISGTGGGFKKFCRGETDIQNASRPIQKEEMELCKTSAVKFIELPVAYDATVVAVNTGNTWVNDISVEDLKKMWEPAAQGQIMTWDQINPKWPKEKLKLYGAGSDSGTFDYFTEAVVGKAKSSRGDYMASENDNTLVTGISKDKYALGYLPLAYYEENKTKLKALAIINPKTKKAIIPSRLSVEKSEYAPLARPIFIYANEASLKKMEVKEFVNYYLKSSMEIIPQVKYIPLPSKVYDLGMEHVKKNKLGTVFGGHSEVGLKIEDLLKREGKME